MQRKPAETNLGRLVLYMGDALALSAHGVVEEVGVGEAYAVG